MKFGNNNFEPCTSLEPIADDTSCKETPIKKIASNPLEEFISGGFLVEKKNQVTQTSSLIYPLSLQSTPYGEPCSDGRYIKLVDCGTINKSNQEMLLRCTTHLREV